MRTSRSVLLAAGALGLIHSALVFAQQAQEPATSPPPWGWCGHGHMWGFGWGFWWIMPLMLLLIFFSGAVFLFLGRRGGGAYHWGPPWHMMDRPGGPWRDPTHSALQILNERYAKGEIGKPEYEERKAAILAGRER